MTIEENEFVVNRVLEERENARLDEINLIGLKHRKGFTEWNGTKLDPDLEKTLRIMPYDNWAEGFYIAKIVKEGGDRGVDESA